MLSGQVDVADHEFALEWMRDFEAFQRALEQDGSYAATLSRSLSLVRVILDLNLPHVSVASCPLCAFLGELTSYIKSGSWALALEPVNQSR